MSYSYLGDHTVLPATCHPHVYPQVEWTTRAGERFSKKIREHLEKLQIRRVIFSRALCAWALSCLKMKNWSAILCMIGRNC